MACRCSSWSHVCRRPYSWRPRRAANCRVVFKLQTTGLKLALQIEVSRAIASRRLQRGSGICGEIVTNSYVCALAENQWKGFQVTQDLCLTGPAFSRLMLWSVHGDGALIWELLKAILVLAPPCIHVSQEASQSGT